MQLEFTTIEAFPPGTIFNLLLAAYSAFHDQYPEYLEENIRSFTDCDTFFYANIPIANKCCLISTYQSQAVGMICWDPREFPQAIIGHNCIIPGKKGNGLGKEQLHFALQEIQKKDFTTCKVSTGLMDFFEPARKMYSANGFIESHRDVTTENTGLRMQDMIYYQLEF